MNGIFLFLISRLNHKNTDYDSLLRDGRLTIGSTTIKSDGASYEIDLDYKYKYDAQDNNIIVVVNGQNLIDEPVSGNLFNFCKVGNGEKECEPNKEFNKFAEILKKIGGEIITKLDVKLELSKPIVLVHWGVNEPENPNAKLKELDVDELLSIGYFTGQADGYQILLNGDIKDIFRYARRCITDTKKKIYEVSEKIQFIAYPIYMERKNNSEAITLEDVDDKLLEEIDFVQQLPEMDPDTYEAIKAKPELLQKYKTICERLKLNKEYKKLIIDMRLPEFRNTFFELLCGIEGNIYRRE